jgi:hypothetical protein
VQPKKKKSSQQLTVGKEGEAAEVWVAEQFISDPSVGEIVAQLTRLSLAPAMQPATHQGRK